MRAEIFIAEPEEVVGYQLEIEVVQQADFEIGGQNIELLNEARVVLRIAAVVGIVHQIHFQLKMAGIDGVRTFGFVGTIGRELSHQIRRSRIEEIEIGLVYIRRRGPAGGTNRQQRENRNPGHRPQITFTRSASPPPSDHHWAGHSPDAPSAPQ